MAPSKAQVRSVVLAEADLSGDERVKMLLAVEALTEAELQVFTYVTDNDIIAYLRSKLPGPTGAGAGAAPTEPGIRSAQAALSLRPAGIAEVPGLWALVDGHGIIQHLFYNAANCKERIDQWLRAYFEGLKSAGIPSMGYLPLYINGLIKTGKSYLLRTALPVLALEHARSTAFSPYILQLDLFTLPVDQGYDAMLQQLLEMIVVEARGIGLASQMLEYAAQFETRPRATSAIYEPVLLKIFELMPHPCIVVIDEVQQLMLPQVPGTGNIDTAAQKQARRLLKTLMCQSASTCAFAVTGSNLTNFWVQLALVEKNSVDPLSYCFDLHLEPVHNAEALSYVKGFLERPLGTYLKAGEALPKAVSVQDWAVNAALVGYASQVKQKGLSDAQVESAVMEKIRQETAAEWRSLLADLPAAERRRYLRLAVPSEGLDLDQVHSHLSGLQCMLSALTVPVYKGAKRRIFASAYHRSAMLMLIANTGEMQDLSLLSGQSLALTAADTLVHMTVIGNAAKAVRLADAKRLQDLLEEPLSKLLSKWGPADSWADTHAWFTEVWFAAENQGKGKQGVSAVEMISSGTAYAYKQQRVKPTTTNADHLAFYLQMLRNIMCHTDEDVASAEGAGGVAADASGAGAESGMPGAAAGGGAGDEATFSAGLQDALTPFGLDRSLEILGRCPFAPQAPELFQALLAYANTPQPSSPSPLTSSTSADSAGTSSSASASNAHSTGSAAGAAVSSPLLGALGWVSGPRAPQSAVVASPQLPMLGPPGRRRACPRGVVVPAMLQAGLPSRRLAAPRCAATHAVHALQRAQAPACRAAGTGCGLRRL